MGKHEKGLRRAVYGLGAFLAGAGAIRSMVGVLAWMTVRSQLLAERLTVVESAPRWAGRRVAGPMTAYAEAEAIKNIALSATGGRTYGEMAEDDPLLRTALDAALLRSSLYTSALAFGVAAAEVGTGVVMTAAGAALVSSAARQSRFSG